MFVIQAMVAGNIYYWTDCDNFCSALKEATRFFSKNSAVNTIATLPATNKFRSRCKVLKIPREVSY